MKLFVGRVPPSYDEAKLKPLFEQFGEVLEVVVLRNRETKEHKGSAFVRMSSITDADRAIRKLNGVRTLEAGHDPLQVRYASREAEKLGLVGPNNNPETDQAKLFVGCLPKTATDEQVRSLFEPFGEIDEIFIMKDVASGEGRGCSFVKFSYKEQAFNAISKLNGSHPFPNNPRALEVRFAEPKGSRAQQSAGHFRQEMGTMIPLNANPRSVGPWKEFYNSDGRPYYWNEITETSQWDRPPEYDHVYGRTTDNAGPAGANVYIFHVPNVWKPQSLVYHFSRFGRIVSARIAIDNMTGRNKGYAFVSFDNVHSAAEAVNTMHGFVVEGKRLKVSIKQGEEQFSQHLVDALAEQTQDQRPDGEIQSDDDGEDERQGGRDAPSHHDHYSSYDDAEGQSLHEDDDAEQELEAAEARASEESLLVLEATMSAKAVDQA